ncbi:MAG: TatD family hydrolase [Nitrospinota bacterium]
MSADSHCHLNDKAFQSDILDVIARLQEKGVQYVLNVGSNIENSKQAIELARKYNFMFASCGIHPHYATTFDQNSSDEMTSLATLDETTAIGETGLDYFRNLSPKEAQIELFIKTIDIAKNSKKPLIIHSRDAMSDTFQIVKDEKLTEHTDAVMHCFSGNKEELKRALNLGLYISYAGNITYKNGDMLRESLSYTPSYRLLLETDSPYLSPVPKRGKRNEPAYLDFTLDLAAKVRSVTKADIDRITVENFKTLFLKEQTSTPAVAYMIRNSLYINVTKKCDNKCFFCGKFQEATVQGHNLTMTQDPTVDEMIDAIGDPSIYDEVVFCGYGEPTIRLDAIKKVSSFLRAHNAKTIRLNTNGHGSFLNKRNILRELRPLIDKISVSLNADNKELYDEICSPEIPDSFNITVAFIKDAKQEGFDVSATIVDIPGKIDVKRIQKFVDGELQVSFRVRDYNLLG